MSKAHFENATKPVEVVRGRPMFDARAVLDSIAAEVLSDQCSYFSRGFKMNAKDDLAVVCAALDEGTKAFAKCVDKLHQSQAEAASIARLASQNTRKAANEMAEGMAKLEKAVNLEKLERMAGALERAAAAMSALAELEKEGRLGRIASALK